jgi:predicted KAP-like P-loop ATPase
MWPDNETDVDFLNFGSVAETIAEVIVQAAGRPISVGVSGAWGVGKSQTSSCRDPLTVEIYASASW